MIIGLLIYLKNTQQSPLHKNNCNITFSDINYNSINNTIFYDNRLNFDEETRKNFDLISKEFSKKYPDKQIFFLRKLGKYDILTDVTCQMELRYYKSKICWKITFYHSIYENEIFIDANTGKIIDPPQKSKLSG